MIATTTTASGTLHRSALFLLVFLVVHMLGNLSVFAGPEAFNGYGHYLSTHPLTKFIEYYLLAAAAVHARGSCAAVALRT